MSLSFYDSYLNIAKTPSEKYKEDLQALMDYQFDNASTSHTIEEEIGFGSLSFQNINVRVGHVITSERGVKLSDDYKKIIFDKMPHATGMGFRYRFDGYIWIVVNCDNIKSVTNSATLRRCNNIMKWYDSTTTLIEEPCIFDYGLRDARFDNGQELVVIDGEMKVIVQKNSKTQTLKVNDRFIFNGQAFIISGINNHAIEKLLTLNLFKVNVSEYDDLVNNIANGLNITPIITIPTEVRITPYQQEIGLNDTVIYEVYKYVNDIKQVNTFTFTPSGIPNNGIYYDFTVIDGNRFSIKNKQKNTVTKLNIQCVSGTDNKTISIDLKGLW